MFGYVHQGKNIKERAKHTLHFCAYHLISIPARMSICNPCMQCFPHNETLQVQASASKLRQLPWTTVFEDRQLLLRSADAPGLTPEYGCFTCLLFHLNNGNQWHMLTQRHFRRSLDNIEEIGAMEHDNLAEILQPHTLSAFQVPALRDLFAETLDPSPSGMQRCAGLLQS